MTAAPDAKLLPETVVHGGGRGDGAPGRPATLAGDGTGSDDAAYVPTLVTHIGGGRTLKFQDVPLSPSIVYDV